MIRRTFAITVKELLQLFRDWRTMLTLLVMPMVLLLIYGFALSFDVEHIRLVVIDHDGSRAAREVREAFLRSGFFDLVASGHDERTLAGMFDVGEAQAALVIPAGYGADLAARRATTVQFVLDGADSRVATVVLAYARQIVASVSPIVRARPGAPAVGVPLVWFNPDLASARFLVPGLIAFILMVSSVIATALAVVREKERGTMESLRATPLVALELLIGKTIPYLLVASLSAAGVFLSGAIPGSVGSTSTASPSSSAFMRRAISSRCCLAGATSLAVTVAAHCMRWRTPGPRAGLTRVTHAPC